MHRQVGEEGGLVTFTVRIPARLKWHLNVRAASTDATIQSIVEAALRSWLGQETAE